MTDAPFFSGIWAMLEPRLVAVIADNPILPTHGERSRSGSEATPLVATGGSTAAGDVVEPPVVRYPEDTRCECGHTKRMHSRIDDRQWCLFRCPCTRFVVGT